MGKNIGSVRQAWAKILCLREIILGWHFWQLTASPNGHGLKRCHSYDLREASQKFEC